MNKKELLWLIKSHEKWASGEGGSKAVIRCESLPPVIVSDYQLPSIVFDGSSFWGCRFVNCNLTYASFEHADLRGVVFENCKLSGANFSDSKLQGAKFDGCNLCCSTFICADVREMCLVNCDVSSAKFDRKFTWQGSYDGIDLKVAYDQFDNPLV